MRYFKIILLLSPLLFLFACVEKIPKLILPVEKIVNTLSDAHVAEGAMLSVRPMFKDSIRKFYYNQIFEIHSVDSISFAHDMEIIKANPELMEKIYEKVTIELNLREKELTKDAKKKKK